jgi:hypothetical protein
MIPSVSCQVTYITPEYIQMKKNRSMLIQITRNLSELNQRLIRFTCKLIETIQSLTSEISELISNQLKSVQNQLETLESSYNLQSFQLKLEKEPKFEMLFRVFDDSSVEDSIKSGFNRIYSAFDDEFDGSSKYKSSFLMFQTKNQNFLNILNLDTLKLENNPVSIDSFTFGSSPVLIGDDKFFVYGGVKKGVLSGQAHIVNFRDNSNENLKGNKNLFTAGGCYMNRSVYIFGGKGPLNENEKLTLKFDLTNKTWSNMCSMPFPSMRVTASRYFSKILVIGFKLNYLLQYNVKDNYYSLGFDFKANTSKYIFENWIIVRKDFLYEIIDENNYQRRSKVDYPLEDLSNYCGYRRGVYIYFAQYDGEIFRIDTENKIVNKLEI